MAYDGFYLTYKSDRETNERLDRIRKKYPNFRMVKINLEDWSDPKIDKAISKIASITNTKHFWIIDPDVCVDDDFDFDEGDENNDVVKEAPPVTEAKVSSEIEDVDEEVEEGVISSDLSNFLRDFDEQLDDLMKI